LPTCIYPCTRDYLVKLNEICRKSTDCLPGKKLNINYDRGKLAFRVSERGKDGSVKRRYLPQRDPLVPKLISKYCAERIIKALQQTSWRLGAADADAFNKLDEVSESLEDLFGGRCPEFVRTRRSILKKWQDESYERNPCEFDNDTNHVTARGERVRSKSEMLAAGIFDRLGIPYRLEYPVKLGGRVVYPDFIFVIPRTGMVYYYESFGRMGDADYVEKTLRKIRDYAKNGITFSDNFIATFESKDIPFDAEAFLNTVKKLM